MFEWNGLALGCQFSSSPYTFCSHRLFITVLVAVALRVESADMEQIGPLEKIGRGFEIYEIQLLKIRSP